MYTLLHPITAIIPKTLFQRITCSPRLFLVCNLPNVKHGLFYKIVEWETVDLSRRNANSSEAIVPYGFVNVLIHGSMKKKISDVED